MEDLFIHKDLTANIIAIFYEVYNELGHGFLERVYKNALYLELQDRGYKVGVETKIRVYYKEKVVGDYIADLIVDDLIILELKACKTILEEHETQLINYLRATDKEVGLVLNFGLKPEFKRKVFSNSRKKLKK
jgi:GxxExxY protein